MTVPAKLLRAVDGEYLAIDRSVVVIGRDESAQIQIPLSAVSRAHAQIERTGHGYVLRDLGSRNGTWVNGVRIDRDGCPLRDGDEIVVGGVEHLRFLDPMATPAAPPIGRLTGVWIDPDSGSVWVDAQPVEPPLSDRQQMLLELLTSREGLIVTREEIIDHVWSDAAADGVSADAIDALVKRLRARIRPLQRGDDEYLEVRRSRGIRLKQV